MSGGYEIVIIGAGPAGLAAAIYAGRARRRTLVLEKGLPGGQILLTDWIENYPGFPEGIAPFDLMEKFRKQAEKFGAEFKMDEVRKIIQVDKGWKVVGHQGEYEARAVIIATGSIYRKLGVNGEAELTGKGVSYCATCDGAFFKDKIVAVVGGGDNALEEALFLTKFARKVYLIHRRDKLRGVRILQERVFTNPKIEVVWNSVVTEIIGQDRLEKVKLFNRVTQKESELSLDGLFISIGMDPNTAFLRGLLELNEYGEIKVSSQMETSRSGIFAAGDVTNVCPKQVATASGSGVAAALAVEEYLSRQE
jgi:thioredoxin reductase (NADPH)